MDWISVGDKTPPKETELRIRLVGNPPHDPGNCLWDGHCFVGYTRAYNVQEVSHWAYAANQACNSFDFLLTACKYVLAKLEGNPDQYTINECKILLRTRINAAEADE